MKTLRLITILTLLFATALGEGRAQRLFRSEFTPYALRVDAQREQRSDGSLYAEFKPAMTRVVNDPYPHIAILQLFTLPYEWSDGRSFLHLENVGSAYKLHINGKEVASNDDPYTPADFELTGVLTQGINVVKVSLSPTEQDRLHSGIERSEAPRRERISNSYFYRQRRIDIFDFEAQIIPDTSGRFGVLNIEAVVENRYNHEEVIEVGFDIYNPEGKLVDYSSLPIALAGGTRDTVRFSTHIYNSNQNRWSSENPKLYKLTLLTKTDGVVRSYITRKVAYVDRQYRAGELFSSGKRVSIRAKRYNATGQRARTVEELRDIKKEGYNTLRPDYPQPRWLYELCDSMGLYIIEQANINAPEGSDDRAVGGTPSNDPALLSEYLERVKSSYYRTRNSPSIIAYSMGGESGNGYNMYKSYQWFKSEEEERPVIYLGSDGEWNSDELIVE